MAVLQGLVRFWPWSCSSKQVGREGGREGGRAGGKEEVRDLDTAVAVLQGLVRFWPRSCSSKQVGREGGREGGRKERSRLLINQKRLLYI